MLSTGQHQRAVSSRQCRAHRLPPERRRCRARHFVHSTTRQVRTQRPGSRRRRTSAATAAMAARRALGQQPSSPAAPLLAPTTGRSLPWYAQYADWLGLCSAGMNRPRPAAEVGRWALWVHFSLTTLPPSSSAAPSRPPTDESCVSAFWVLAPAGPGFLESLPCLLWLRLQNSWMLPCRHQTIHALRHSQSHPSPSPSFQSHINASILVQSQIPPPFPTSCAASQHPLSFLPFDRLSSPPARRFNPFPHNSATDPTMAA